MFQPPAFCIPHITCCNALNFDPSGASLCLQCGLEEEGFFKGALLLPPPQPPYCYYLELFFPNPPNPLLPKIPRDFTVEVGSLRFLKDSSAFTKGS